MSEDADGTISGEHSPQIQDAAGRRWFVAIAVVTPVVSAALGLNGGAIFQIVALENLGLNAEQIGLAVGLGAVSIPFQIWASRIPLRLARRHLTLYIATTSMLCLLLAWLIQAPISATVVVAAAMLIAVLAELAVSVLWATSWQPLLSTSVTPNFRQRLNAQARAAGGVLVIAVVAIFGLLGSTGRTSMLVAIGLVGVVLLVPAIRRLPLRLEAPSGRGDATDPVRQGDAAEQSVPRALYVAIAIASLPAWPFIVTYSATSFWPTANLGVIGAAVVAGPLLTSALWRPTDRLLTRARAGTLAMLLAAAALVAIRQPVSGLASATAVVVIVIAAGAATTAIRLSLLETAHRLSTSRSLVRVLTLVDVVASTAMQVGFLAAGYLINLSADSSWPVDPYRISLVAAPAILFAVLGRRQLRTAIDSAR